MKRAIYFAVTAALLGVATLVSAQSKMPSGSAQPSATASPKTIVIQEPGATCPVAMRALQGSGQGMIRVRKQEPQTRQTPPSDMPTQRIHLILVDQKRKTVRSAQVVVKGLSPKNRIQSVLESNGPTDISKTMTATFDVENATTVSAELVLPGFTSVSSVELQSITYTDGSTWNLAKDQACRVSPDGLMLVAEQ